MRRTWLITLVLGLLAALAAPAVAAPPSTQGYEMAETLVDLVTPGTERYSGNDMNWHVRGWTADYETSGELGAASEMTAGAVTVEVNWNLNLRTWRGNLWGTADYHPDAYPGSGWNTTWTAQWTGVGTWEGQGVGDGFGVFEGMKIRYDVRNTGPSSDVVSGFVFTPGQP